MLSVYIVFVGKYQPFTLDNKSWKKATGKDGKLFKHESSSAHKAATEMYKAHMEEWSSVAVHLSQAYAEQLRRDKEQREKNRAALESIIDVIRFLARQNISFRGHREGKDSDNRGNFLELIHFVAKYNPLLQVRLGSHPRNVSWLSPEIQNELLHLLSLEVVSQIADDLRGSCFSILCDEVSDCSNSELVSIILRYVTTFGFIREAVVGLIKADSTAAANLCSVIDARLKELRLSVNDIVGQCYDSASNVRSH